MTRNDRDWKLAKDLADTKAQSEVTQERMKTIIEIEELRLRNIQLRTEVLMRTRGE
jgi:hypothetical protein